MNLYVAAFTARGVALAERLCSLFPAAEASAPERIAAGLVAPMNSLDGWTKAHFQTGNTLLFIGATGIAVRAIAPYIKSKETDPAVLCMDERGRHVIPLLSGHLGGANRAAREIAEAVGGRAILTTATDVEGIFSPDDWAREQGLRVAELSAIRTVSAALLESKPVGFISDYPIEGPLPEGLTAGAGQEQEMGIYVGLGAPPFPHTLQLLPPVVVAGMGCRKGVPEETLRQKLEEAMEKAKLPMRALTSIVSIDLKAAEPGLLALCKNLSISFCTYSADELAALPGEFTLSERVQKVTGVDNVCERAVVAAGGSLVLRKQAGDGVTVALGLLPWIGTFET
ncbi:MAG: cobalt-precorrin 5A hydrolase [Oscillospiraceae bacterium]